MKSSKRTFGEARANPDKKFSANLQQRKPVKKNPSPPLPEHGNQSNEKAPLNPNQVNRT